MNKFFASFFAVAFLAINCAGYVMIGAKIDREGKKQTEILAVQNAITDNKLMIDSRIHENDVAIHALQDAGARAEKLSVQFFGFEQAMIEAMKKIVPSVPDIRNLPPFLSNDGK